MKMKHIDLWREDGTSIYCILEIFSILSQIDRGYLHQETGISNCSFLIHNYESTRKEIKFHTECGYPPHPGSNAMIKDNVSARKELHIVAWCLYTPQNRPSTLRPCITTPQPAIRLISHRTAKTSIGTSNSSVLCKKGRALYPRKVI